MKKEIKFKGLRTDGGGWEVGDLVSTNHNVYIIDIWFIPALSTPTERFTEVKQDTVGQYNGTFELFEGDKVKLNSELFFDNGNTVWDEGLTDEVGTVSLSDLGWEIKLDSNESIMFFELEQYEIELEVTGNIHEK